METIDDETTAAAVDFMQLQVKVNDDGNLVAYPYCDWKVVFCEQSSPGGFEVLSQSIHMPAPAKSLQSSLGPHRAG